MRKKMVEGEYQIDSWPKGPERSLCPLARPDIAMGPESQIEAWSAGRLRRCKTPGSHRGFASIGRRTTTVSKAETTCHRLRDDQPAERRGRLRCQGQQHRGRGRNTLDIPLHRRDLWNSSVWHRRLTRRRQSVVLYAPASLLYNQAKTKPPIAPSTKPQMPPITAPT